MKPTILFLLLVCSLAMVGCNTASASNDLTESIVAKQIETVSVQLPSFYKESVKLLQSDKEQENILVSPLSIHNALGMTANGAAGATQSEFEQYFQMEINPLNQMIGSFNQTLQEDGESELLLANSIWLETGLAKDVENDFLSSAKTYYDAQVFTADFDSKTTDDINAWVSEHTKERIPKIVDDVTGSVAVLVNALSFDAQWLVPYNEAAVADGTFTNRKGEAQTVPMMGGKESFYIEDEDATGFEKLYKDKFSFVALLPKQDMDSFLAALTPKKLENYLTQRKEETVQTSIPKFKAEYSTSLKDALSSEIPSAFDPDTADFSKIEKDAVENLFISDVLHKTMIEVDELGTKAGAATAVILERTAAEEAKIVNLDRPFVYAIVDQETRLPLFIGVLDTIQ